MLKMPQGANTDTQTSNKTHLIKILKEICIKMKTQPILKKSPIYKTLS